MKPSSDLLLGDGRLDIGGLRPESRRRANGAVAVAVIGMAGWIIGQLSSSWRFAPLTGAVVGVALTLVVLAVPIARQSLWSWVTLRVRRLRTIAWPDPFPVAANRAGGGVRVVDGVAVVAVQVLGKSHEPSLITGSSRVQTANVLDIEALLPLVNHPLGLKLDSISAVSLGSRRGRASDYATTYDSIIGTASYAGKRETWLVVRMAILPNTSGLQWRTTVGSAAVAVAQRIVASLRGSGLQARVATGADMTELDKRLGADALTAENQRWRQLRATEGWLTTFAYPPEAIRTDVLAAAWTMQDIDEMIQNVTIYGDGTCTALVTVRTRQPLPAPPSVVLRPLNGQQGPALAAAMCGPRLRLRSVPHRDVPRHLSVEIGPSGVLVGKLPNGDKLLMPLDNRVWLSGDDSVIKRIIIRLGATGERISVHSKDSVRWDSVRMPDLLVVNEARPAPRSTVSVIDGVGSPSPRPATVISVNPPGTKAPDSGFDVAIEQLDDRWVRVTSGGREWTVEVEKFTAENRFCRVESVRARRRL